MEPTVRAAIVLPTEAVGTTMELCQERRGELTEHAVLGQGRTLLRQAEAPPPPPVAARRRDACAVAV